MPSYRWKAKCPMPDCKMEFRSKASWSIVTSAVCWSRMEAHFWECHFDEADSASHNYIANFTQRHPARMTQEHKNTAAELQEQEEWPSDDDAPTAEPRPSSENNVLRPERSGTSTSADPCLNTLVGNLISSANALTDYVKREPYCRLRGTVPSYPRRGTAASSANPSRSRSPCRSRRSRSLAPNSAYEDWWRWREQIGAWHAAPGRQHGSGS